MGLASHLVGGVPVWMMLGFFAFATGCGRHDAPIDESPVVAGSSGPSSAGAGARTALPGLSSIPVDSFFSDVNGWNSPTAYPTIRYPDVDGDGRSDVCGRNQSGVFCSTDDGTGKLVPSAAAWAPAFDDAHGWGDQQRYLSIAYPDLDGNGKADLCGRTATGLVCALSNGKAFATPRVWSADFADAAGIDAPFADHQLVFGDLDGDGRADVCGRTVSGLLCARSTGLAFGPAKIWSAAFSDAAGFDDRSYAQSIALRDVDGDGKADACGRLVNGVTCAVSDGASSFRSPSVWTKSFDDADGWSVPLYGDSLRFADIDGDGRSDVCGRSSFGLVCARSIDSAFGTTLLWGASYSDADSWAQVEYASTLRIDHNVACARGSNGISCSFSNPDQSVFNGPSLESATESDANGWNAPEYYTTFAVTFDHKITSRGPNGIVARPLNLTDDLTVTTSDAVAARRVDLVRHVWGVDALDTAQGIDADRSTIVTSSSNPPTDVVTPPAEGVVVHRYTVGFTAEDGTSRDVMADLYALPGSKSLAVVNPGHICHYATHPDQDSQAVVALLQDGYAVLATYMPGYNPLDCSADHSLLFDPTAGKRPANGASPLLYFLDPVRRSINQAITDFGYTRIVMAGLSGGGWTTTLYAALDPRITTSVPIAGSLPMYMRWPGDAEQEDAPYSGNDFFDFTTNGRRVKTGYKDLYVLGSSGPGRRQVQVVNRNDDCCFGQDEYVGLSPRWDHALRGYEGEVREALQSVGSGAFRVEINEADDSCTIAGACPFKMATHEWSTNSRINGILAAFDGSHRYLGSSAGTKVFGRGVDGTLLYAGASGQPWIDTGLVATGTPAVLENTMHSVDLFYRDAWSRITHATVVGDEWTTVDDLPNAMRIVSDPAVSTDGRRIDVVAIDQTYSVVHFVYDGSTWRETTLASAVRSNADLPAAPYAVGQLAVATWGSDRVDVYYRTKDDALFHVSSSAGLATGEVLDFGHQTKHFPAVSASPGVDPSVFVVGTDDQLYFGRVSDTVWSWTNLSSTIGAGPVRGSPAAFRNGDTIGAYVRSGNRFRLLTYGNEWSKTDLGPMQAFPFFASPTATTRNVLALDTTRAGWAWDAGSGWLALGGYVDR
ncbi:MAG TPA: hypothetical protein VF407_17870 [Polyangiaceae bacterium]